VAITLSVLSCAKESVHGEFIIGTIELSPKNFHQTIKQFYRLATNPEFGG